jgi:chitinase
MNTVYLIERMSAAARCALASLFMLFVLLALSTNCLASTITLQWDPETAPDLGGYKVYYSTSAVAPFTGTGATQGASPVSVSSATTATITGLDPGQAYYFAVTAYNSAGVESPYSNTVLVPELLPPTVSISSPATASGTVSVGASASDNVGVTRLEFYVNGVLAATDTATPYLFSWNTDSLSSGIYTLSAKAYDAAGNVGQSSNVPVTVINDRTPPRITLSAPGNGATVRGIVPITATATDDIAVTKVELFANNSLLYAGNVAPYSYNWDTTALADGSYTLFARAYDAANNIGQSYDVQVNVLNVQADLTAPAVSISAPAVGSVLSGTVSVSAKAIDNVGVAKVQFYLNGVLSATVSAAPYSYSLNSAALADGSYTLVAKAYDAAGNVGQSADVQVSVLNTQADKTAPVVSISAPAASSILSGTVTVSAKATDNVGIAKVQFYLNGVLASTVSAAPYNFSWNTAQSANASYLIFAVAYDAMGNVGMSAGVPVAVSNDKVAPVVAISTPLAGTQSGKVSVTASASDNVKVTKVEFYLNDVLQSTVSAAPYGFAWNTLLVANGLNTLSARAYDAAGNVAKSAPVMVSVFNDTAAPVVAISAPLANSTQGGTVSVSAKVSDNVGVAKVEFYLNGVLQSTVSAAPYSFNWNTLLAANGSYSVSANAYDAAGNVGQAASVAVTVFNDTTAPVVTSFSMPAITNCATVAVSSFSATDNVAVIGYLISESATAPTAAAAEWNLTPPTSFTFAGTGTRTAYAWTKDAAGNVSASKATSVLIDTILPVIRSLTLRDGNGAMTIKASVSDNSALDKLQLYVDNALQLETSEASFSYAWTAGFQGTHTITVKALDAAGNLRSQSVNVIR